MEIGATRSVCGRLSTADFGRGERLGERRDEVCGPECAASIVEVVVDNVVTADQSISLWNDAYWSW
jgi:hypothetical protein